MRKLVIAMMVAAACGGGSGGSLGTGPITQAEAEEVCTADCQREIDCGNEQELAACVTNCTQDMVGWARADAVDTIFSCTAALGCDASDDECLDDVLPLPIHEEWEAACRSDLGGCLEPTEIEGVCEVSPVGDSDAGFVRFIAPEIVEDMIDCLAGPACEERLGCLENVFATHNIDF